MLACRLGTRKADGNLQFPIHHGTPGYGRSAGPPHTEEDVSPGERLSTMRRNQVGKKLRNVRAHLSALTARGELDGQTHQELDDALRRADHASKTGNIDDLRKAVGDIAGFFLR